LTVSRSGRATAAADPLQAALNRRLAGVDDLGGASRKWRDRGKLANLSVEAFGRPADAHEAHAAIRVFARGWGERTGHVRRAEAVAGLGDEAWRLWVGGNGVEVTYEWRRRNLTLEAHVHCWAACPADVDRLTRSWVDAIDADARPGN
jgi:hypothetical protein